MSKLLLHSIYNRNTEQEVLKEKSNRICTLDFNDDFTEMIIKFEKGGTLKHFEEVEDIAQDDYGVWVTTTRKLWRFDNIYDKENINSESIELD